MMIFGHLIHLFLLLYLKVKKTTLQWFGFGCMRVKPSAAHPVALTTNSFHTSYPTETCTNTPILTQTLSPRIELHFL